MTERARSDDDRRDGPLAETGDPAGGDLARLAGRGHMPPKLRHATGMQKIRWILDRPDPRGFVRSLATGELYFLVNDVGPGDSGALLELASDEQIQGLVDLDVWSRNELRVERWVRWLDVARAADVDTAMRFIRATETELLEYLFTAPLRVFTHELELETISDEEEVLPSPDGAFHVVLPRDHELVEPLPELMKLLWATDMERMREIFDAVRFELPSELEERLIQFRRGRLEDMGFVAPEEALGVYARREPEAVRKRLRDELDEAAPMPVEPQGEVVQDLVLRDVQTPSFLARVLGALDEADRAHVAEALTYLVNKVFMARTGDLSHTDDLPDAGRHAARLANLGLAHLADESVETGAQVLQRVWPEELFRVGFTLIDRLGRRARDLRKRAAARTYPSLFGAPTDDVLEAAAARPPMLFEGLDEPGAMSWRDFADPAELARVEAVVGEAEALLRFFEEQLGLTSEVLLGAEIPGLAEDDRRQLGLGTLFRTGLAQLLLTDEFRFEPIAPDDLPALQELAFERTGDRVQLRTPLRRAVDDLLGRVSDEVARWVERTVEELREQLGGIAPDEIEPAYAREVLLVRRETAGS